jgi:hypothetical protein
MRSYFFLCLASWAVSGGALAQSRSEWRNPELLAKGRPPSQYAAIGRGYLSQCQAKSSAAARQVIADAQAQCNNLMGAFCGMLLAQKQQEAERVYRDVVVSCMSEKGWFWLPVEP